MDWHSTVSYCGSCVYFDKIGTVFQALCPSQPAQPINNICTHICVCGVYKCTCVFMLITEVGISYINNHSWQSSTVGQSHKSRYYICWPHLSSCSPYSSSVSTSMPAQHTLNYEHIINSVDTPGGLEGLRPHPTQALNGPLALWGAQREDLRSKSGDLMLKDNKSAQSLNTMHPYFKRLLCFHFYFTAQAWLQIIFFTLF